MFQLSNWVLINSNTFRSIEIMIFQSIGIDHKWEMLITDRLTHSAISINTPIHSYFANSESTNETHKKNNK